MNNKIIKTLLLSVMVMAFLSGCLDFWHPLEEEKEEKTVVSSVTIIPDSASVSKGRALQFGAEVIGSNSPAQTVTWSVFGGGYDTAISEKGLLTVADDETATSLIVRATSTADNSKSCNATVTISTTAIAITDVSLNKTTLSLTVGGTETLIAAVMPVDAANKVVLWSSSNAAVASVSSTGDVIGMSTGSATITVTTTDGNKTATCSVTVTGGGSSTVAVTGVSLNKSSLSLTVGGSETLSATVSPSNATNKNVSWSSSNTAVATVSGGTVSAVSAGSASITVTTYDGNKTATCSVTVKSGSSTVAVSSVSLNKSSATITVGNIEVLTATVSPSNATNKNVTWSSGNTSVATVNQSGQVTAVSAGSAIITVTTQDGNKTATCSVTVTVGTVSVTGVTLNKSSTTITVGNTETLTATVAPSNATNKNVSWSTSAPAVATVSGGTVSAVSTGNATIIVTTQDGGKIATCDVTVTAAPVPVTGVTLDKNTLTLDVSGTETLIATVLPSNATNKAVKWKSDNESVATVTNGLVTAKAVGNTNITVTTEDGGFTATCTVTVTVPVTGVTLNKTMLELDVGDTGTLITTVLPSNATNKNVSWSSSNTAVATVSVSGLNGTVTAVSAGTAGITVTTEDGGFTATCTVTVKKLNKLTFNVNGGLGTVPASQTVNNGTEITIPSGSELSKSGYAFVGWNTNASGTGTSYYAGSSYKVISDETMYAKWTLTSYNVTLLATSTEVGPGNGKWLAANNSFDIPELQSVGYKTLRITLTCRITRISATGLFDGGLLGQIRCDGGYIIGNLSRKTGYNNTEDYTIDIWPNLDSKLNSLTVVFTVPDGGKYKVENVRITMQAEK